MLSKRRFYLCASFLLAQLTILLGFIFASMAAHAQNPSPQPNFAAQVYYAGPPANYVNFNDFTTSFKDQITGLSFSTPAIQVGVNPATLSSTPTAGYFYISNAPAPTACSATTLNIQYYATPTAGSKTFAVMTPTTLPAFTTGSTFTATVAATTALQHITLTGVSLSAGQYIGIEVPTGDTAPGRAGSIGTNLTGYYDLASSSGVPSGTNTYTLVNNTPLSFSVTCNGAATVLPRQPGFDNTQVNNTSASYPWYIYSVAPNDTTGDWEWSTPQSILFHIDNLQWARSGTKVLLSKGQVPGTGASWQLYVYMVSSNIANFCVQMYGTGGTVAPNIVNQTTCTTSTVDEPNGLNYDIIVTNDGTGQPNTAGLNLFVNGLDNVRYINAGGSYAFGAVTITVGGSGTGYANATPFYASGGGTNCTVDGTLNASSGVPSTVTLTYTQNYGCTSVPTIVLAPYVATISGSGTGYANSTAFTSSGGGTGCSITGTMTSVSGVPQSVTTTASKSLQLCTSAPTLTFTSPTGTGETITAAAPTGTGVTLTAAAFGAHISTSTTLPAVVMGYWNGSYYTGSYPTSDSSNDIDELAWFDSVLTNSQIQSLFYQTKFYQLFATATTANPPLFILSEDVGDQDNQMNVALTIRAHQLGYLKLLDLDDSENNGLCIAAYRQMLDAAGLNNIPVSTPSVAHNANTCTTVGSLNTYNATTPQTVSAYPQSVTIWRQIFAANPTTPIFIEVTGGFTALSDFMQSPADSISSMTGAQLLAQDAVNGGKIYFQGLGPAGTYGGDNGGIDLAAAQYITTHNCGSGGCGSSGAMPLIWIAGSPANGGPGVFGSRYAKDPLYLAFLNYRGTDTRTAFDSEVTSVFLSSLFTGGVTITIGGSGTGYANQTAFTSSGGGTNCSVSGTLVSVSGVPSSILTSPVSAYPTYYGYGSGCTSAPTLNLVAPTGTGVTLTAAPLSFCGTVTYNSATNIVVSSATCSQQYFMNASNFSQYNYLTWFLNAFIDPPQNGAPKSQ